MKKSISRGHLIYFSSGCRKQISCIAFLSLIVHFTILSQTSVTLQPGLNDGKDAEIWSLQPNSVYEDDLIRGAAWTFQGVFGIVRGFIQFDLSAIPAGSEIDSAFLSLYSPHSPNTQFHSGESAAFLRRITSAWEEGIVSWNQQPLTTNVHEIALPKAYAEYQDYPRLNVTSLVRDMISDPLHSFGFALILQDEQKYSRISFCASEYPDASKHPKLEIYYNKQDSQIGHQEEVVFFPSPFADWIKVKLHTTYTSVRFEIYDILGRLLLDQVIDPQLPLDMATFVPGLYIIQCYDESYRLLGQAKMVKP